jgi:hypothetical protein
VRRKHATLLLACLLALALPPEARPQDPGLQPYYWPHRTVGIPVDVERIGKLQNKPSELQLYYWTGGRDLQKGPKLALGAMQQLDGGKRGFLFTADRDGDYEFTVQFVYPDNTTSPRSDDLSPQQRVVVDTTPPQVRVYPSNTGVAWEAGDENLEAQGVVLECRWPGDQTWTKVTERAFRARDQFAWKLPAGKVLEVRVQASDRAGNKGHSPVTRVPPDAATGVGFPKAGGPEWPGTNPNLPQARIDYVNTLDFHVDYTVQRMGPSGVRAAHLFVLKNQSNWEFVKKYDVRLAPNDKDQSISLAYSAKEEGIYGFYVLPESGAGKRANDPKRDDPPMVHVVVDKTAPYVRITSVQIRKGGARGPLVDITWEAADPNLMPQPISLEWSTDAKAAKWNEVKYRLSNTSQNTGRYTWEVPDESLWKFYLRARAVDKAANTGEHVWGQDLPDKKNAPTEVIVDLEVPSGSVNRVRGGNTPKEPGGSDAPPKNPPGVPDLPKLPGGNLPD